MLVDDKNFSIMNDYPEVVKQIHNEFNIAGERLLAESLEIINNAEQVDVDKAQSLNSVGFINSPLLKHALQIAEQTSMSHSVAKAINDYAAMYRNHKFISIEDVTKINKKYGLAMGGVENYKGFVPSKNLAEIKAFMSTYPLLTHY